MTRRARLTRRPGARPAWLSALVATLALAVLFGTAGPGPLPPTQRPIAVTTPLVPTQDGAADGSADGSGTGGDPCTDGGCGGGPAEKGGGGGGDTSSAPAEREKEEPSGTDGAKPTTAPGAAEQRADEPDHATDGATPTHAPAPGANRGVEPTDAPSDPADGAKPTVVPQADRAAAPTDTPVADGARPTTAPRSVRGTDPTDTPAQPVDGAKPVTAPANRGAEPTDPTAQPVDGAKPTAAPGAPLAPGTEPTVTPAPPLPAAPAAPAGVEPPPDAEHCVAGDDSLNCAQPLPAAPGSTSGSCASPDPADCDNSTGFFDDIDWKQVGHTTLDVAGLVPGVGEFADGANAAWYAAEGDYVNAGLSGAAAIPFAGWFATGAKGAKRVGEAVTDGEKAVDDIPTPGVPGAKPPTGGGETVPLNAAAAPGKPPLRPGETIPAAPAAPGKPPTKPDDVAEAQIPALVGAPNKPTANAGNAAEDALPTGPPPPGTTPPANGNGTSGSRGGTDDEILENAAGAAHPQPGKLPAAVQPSTTDPKLTNILNDLYKGTKNATRTGDGTTADAVRHELATGEQVGNKTHSTKARDYINGLDKWIRRNQNNPNASESELNIARAELKNLQDALAGK